MKILFLIFIPIFLGLGIWGTTSFLKKETPQAFEQVNPLVAKSPAVNASAKPSDFPFRDMTIPYLREQTFESKLGQLEKVSDGGTYTSYLTSYNSGELKVNGLLTKPTGEEPANGWPAVIFIHGYIPPNQYQTLTRYTDHVNFLARNNLVVFKIDLRGHGESEGEASGAYYSTDYIIDVLNAYSALQNTDFVNPDAIGLWGHSMAGNVVMRAVATRPEIPAAVIWAGAVYTYTDLAEFGIQDSSYQPQPSDSGRQRRRQLLRETYGEPSADSSFWKQVAPTTYLNDLIGAIQIHHAVDDNVVEIGYSRNLNKLLDQTDVEHELHEYSSGGHNIIGGSFTQAMQRSVDFYKKYL